MSNDDQIIALLGAGQPETARKFLGSWEERRNASFIDANREAKLRSASGGHEPAVRGQLRYHMGEQALKPAAQSSGLGHLAMSTIRPGASFIAARVGRFALVSINVRDVQRMPRRSATRLSLSQSNQDIDPQPDWLIESSQPTVLAYLGCLASVPNPADHTAPRELAIAIPSRDLRRWISWIPINRAAALLLGDAGSKSDPSGSESVIPDNAFATLRLPPQETTDEQ